MTTRDGAYSNRQLLVALVAAAIATFAQLYSPQGVLPQIATDLGTSADRAALAVSAATLGLALTVIPWSFVGDRYGRRRAMLVAVVGATTLGFLAAWMPSFELVLVVRLFEGAFLGGVPALAMAYLNDEVESRVAVVVAGWFVGGTTIGGLLGRIVATPVADFSSWRVGMTTVSVLAACAAVVFILYAPPERRFTPIRSAGPLEQAQRILTNLRDRPLAGLYLNAFLLMGGFVAAYNYLGFHLVADPYSLPAWAVGLMFLAFLAGTISAPRAGMLSLCYGRHRVLVGMTLTMLLGLLLTLAEPVWLIIGGLTVFTAGFFGAHSVASGWAGARAVTARSQSTGLYNFAYYAGSSLLGWAGGFAWEAAQWSAVVGFVSVSTVLALVVSLTLVRGSN